MPFDETLTVDPPQEAEAAASTDSSELGTAQDNSSVEAGTGESAEVEANVGAENDGDANWLPEEQNKVFSDDDYARYIKRYGYTQEEFAALDPRAKRLLHDKINSDIEIGKFKSQPEQEEEAEEAEETADQPPIQATPQQREQVINQFVDQVTDPEVAKKFVNDFTKAFEIKNEGQRSVAVTKALTRALVNVFPDLVNAYLFAQPGQTGLLDQYIESRYEGLGDTVAQTSYSRSWNDMVASDPKLANLPAYDTRPNSEWTKAITKVAALVPGFENFTIPGASKAQNFAAKARIAAQLLSNGGNASAVATAQQAVETGKRIANEANRNKQLGKLGAGQSKGQIVTKNDDPLKAAQKASLDAHRADNNPFAALGRVDK